MANDARIAEIESALAAAAAEIEGLKDQVRATREASRVSPIALWGPALATAVTISGLAVFVLDERIGPILGDVRQAQRDIRDLSAIAGEIKRENVSQEERLDFQRDWLMSVQQTASTTREEMLKLKARR